MGTQNSSELFLLLEDYGKSVSRCANAAGRAILDPSERPIWLESRDFARRLAWQFAHSADGGRLSPSDTPVPKFLVDRFDPAELLREAAGRLVWPADPTAQLQLRTSWAHRRVHPWAAAAFVHAAALAVLLVPGTMQLETTKPADWDSVRITLMAPSLEDLPPLERQSNMEGEGDGGFRGLPQPPSDLVPGPDPLPEAPAEPVEAAEVPQPIQSPEPEPEVEEPPTIEPAEEPEPVPTPAAASPDPGEFQPGKKLAQARDPRLLPMPAAPTRTRAALQLEAPKARMPSRSGSPQLGTLELTARPDQVIQGAIQNMIRGGGGRQAVGDGIGGPPATAVLPSGPSNSGSAVELLSDPRGVDFRPYLTQVLAAVRRNWFAVIPESARMGMNRGRTLIQFSVARNGSVPKLVIARSSGIPPLDRAAVAGISASNPFPPLPEAYLGRDIRLQFTFLYNIRNP